MIDQVKLCTKENAAGKKYDAVVVWIGGVAFSADLVGAQMERLAAAISAKSNCPFMDCRDKSVAASAMKPPTAEVMAERNRCASLVYMMFDEWDASPYCGFDDFCKGEIPTAILQGNPI